MGNCIKTKIYSINVNIECNWSLALEFVIFLKGKINKIKIKQLQQDVSGSALTLQWTEYGQEPSP